MTKNKKSSIVKRQWSQQNKQFINKNIVVTSQAKLALQELLDYLNKTVDHPYLKSVVLKQYWIDMQMPIILPYGKDHPSFSVPLKIFVLQYNGEIKYLLVEQFLEDDYDIDMTINYAI